MINVDLENVDLEKGLLSRGAAGVRDAAREETCRVLEPAFTMDCRISCTLWGSFMHTEALDSSGI